MFFRALIVSLMVAFWGCAASYAGRLNEGTSKELESAYRSHKGSIEGYIRAENDMRGTVIRSLHEEDMAARRRWARERDWPQPYKDMFERAVKWSEETLRRGPDHLYRLSVEYRKMPDAERTGFKALSYILLGTAALAGHAEAIHEARNGPSNNVTSAYLGNAKREMYSDAVSGYTGILSQLSIAYLIQPIFEHDRAKGYYWYLRAKEAGPPAGSKWRDWISPVSAEQREQAESWIKSGHVPAL
jgi:hypothetical protein